MFFKDSQGFFASRLNFGKLHPTKFGSIQPSMGKPLYEEGGIRYNKISVKYNDGNAVIFLADGKKTIKIELLY